MSGEVFLVLGGAGLVGRQVVRSIASDLDPRVVVIAARTEESATGTVAALRSEFGDRPIRFEAEWGDVFQRSEHSKLSRRALLADGAARDAVFADLLGPFDPAYRHSALAALILRHRPDVVVDAINTATAISYQDVYTASVRAERSLARLGEAAPTLDTAATVIGDVETLILSQAVPQLIRHVQVLHRALQDAGTRLYLKVGTTGTGGMGLDIPYTHSEDRPSSVLMTKTAVAFAHTGLLFLMARTSGGPLVKELKPAAMIGYTDVATRPIRERGEEVHLYRARPVPIARRLQLRMDPAGFSRLGDLRLPVVDTGENGLFTRGEFETITAVGQMEFLTPEEIAHVCVLEIRGGNTGYEVLGALDSAMMGPTYRAGVLRPEVLDQLRRLEESTGTPSVALGQLGPPELSKLLWEAEFLKLEYGTVAAVLAATPEELAERIAKRLEGDDVLRDTVTSLGIPILTADGRELIRGPFLRIPEVPTADEIDVSPEEQDLWAAKGWVDLRASNFAVWRDRLTAMAASRADGPPHGSSAVSPAVYSSELIEIGPVVAWLFTNELGAARIK